MNKESWVWLATSQEYGRYSHPHNTGEALLATDGFRLHAVQLNGDVSSIGQNDEFPNVAPIVNASDSKEFTTFAISANKLRDALPPDGIAIIRIYNEDRHHIEVYWTDDDASNYYAAIIPRSGDWDYKRWKPVIEDSAESGAS